MISKKAAAALFSLLVVVSMLAVPCVGAAPPPQSQDIGKIDPNNLPAKETLFYARFGVGDIPTLDPSLATDTSSIQMGLELFVGLTRLQEETAAVEPGMATEWKVSDDGLVYTFKLRNDVPWVHYDPNTGQAAIVNDENGKPRMVNAHDFEYGIKRTLDPKTGSTYNYVNWIIKNAQAVAGGAELADKDPLYGQLDEIGVKVVDDYTLEITLTQPAGFFSGIASMWINWAEPKWLIEEKGDKWTEAENLDSYGPYLLGNWTHDVAAVLVANPFWPGADNIPKPSIKYVHFTMLDDSPSFANYEAGLADVSVVPVTEMDRVKADPVLSKELKTPPDLCTYYYGFNTTKPPFDDVNVRKALSWAINRQAIVDNVSKGGQIPARWFSRPGLTAAPDPALGDDFGPPANGDPAKAREFLAASKYGSADKLPEITLMANQVEGHVKIAEAIQQMWQDALGVKVNLVTQEWNVYLHTLDEDPPQVWRLGWCYDYPDADNFARGVFRSDSGNNHTKWKNAKYDQIVDQAAAETDPQKRHDLYVQSEKMLVEEDAIIAPIYWYTSVQITKPYVTRTYGVGDHQAFEKWKLNK
jgi:oligopeptide transport system substrate-binding protein